MDKQLPGEPPEDQQTPTGNAGEASNGGRPPQTTTHLQPQGNPPAARSARGDGVILDAEPDAGFGRRQASGDQGRGPGGVPDEGNAKAGNGPFVNNENLPAERLDTARYGSGKRDAESVPAEARRLTRGRGQAPGTGDARDPESKR